MISLSKMDRMCPTLIDRFVNSARHWLDSSMLRTSGYIGICFRRTPAVAPWSSAGKNSIVGASK